MLKILLSIALLSIPAVAQVDGDKSLNAPSSPLTSTDVTIDFGKTIGTSTPYIFGVNRWPQGPGQNTEISRLGITWSRNIIEVRDQPDCALLPKTDDATYIAGIGVPGSVADPETWNWSCGSFQQVFLAESTGVPVVLTLHGAPTWDTYSGGRYGVPHNNGNFLVYADILSKVTVRMNPDEVIIVNEPDYSLDLTGSPYGTQLDAYIAMYRAAAAAIHKLLPGVPIGGPDICCSDPKAWIPPFLQSSIPAADINFIDYHNYQDTNDELFNGVNVVALARAIRPGIPVYLTEWNADSGCMNNGRNADDATSVSFVGMRLINQINIGLSKSAFWASYLDVYCAYFSQPGSVDPPLPKAGAWFLISSKLGLGAGNYIVKAATPGRSTTAMGAINSIGQHVAALVNDSSSTLDIRVDFSGLPDGSFTQDLYQTTFTSMPNSPYNTASVTISDHQLITTITLAPYSVTGIVLR